MRKKVYKLKGLEHLKKYIKNDGVITIKNNI